MQESKLFQYAVIWNPTRRTPRSMPRKSIEKPRTMGPTTTLLDNEVGLPTWLNDQVYTNQAPAQYMTAASITQTLSSTDD